MKERVQGVQRAFWVLCATGVLVVLMGMPLAHDGETMRLHTELRAFAAGFDQGRIETDLLAHARAQGRVPLSAVSALVAGDGLPELVADGPALDPRSAVDLGDLGAVHALSRPGATLDIVAPEPESVAIALGWRLARRSEGHPGARWRLARLSLAEGGASADEIDRERKVAQARVALRRAVGAHEEAMRAHTAAEEVYTARRKWKAHWKAIAKADERRQETATELAGRTADLARARTQYEQLALASEGFAAGAPAGQDGLGVAVATVAADSGGQQVTLALPVSLVRRAVPVPSVRGAELPLLRGSALWPELAKGSGAHGIMRLERRFSWHYRHMRIGPFQIGGTTALQVAPLLFLAVLGMLLQRVRSVRRSYNPFDAPPDMVLPKVGFGPTALNFLPLVVLPLLACAVCTWSLVQLEQIVILPVLACVVSLVLGAWTFAALQALLNLRDAVRRTHSSIPGAPS